MNDVKGHSHGRGSNNCATWATWRGGCVSFAKYIERQVPNFEILNAEAIEIIEANADRVLEVKGERVHIPRGLARELCKTAPSEYTQMARDPAKNVVIGGKNLVLAPVYGPPFVRDLEGGRRYATMDD